MFQNVYKSSEVWGLISVSLVNKAPDDRLWRPSPNIRRKHVKLKIEDGGDDENTLESADDNMAIKTEAFEGDVVETQFICKICSQLFPNRLHYGRENIMMFK